MKQYEAVIVKLTGNSREDEVAVTDLLNERMRMGWDFDDIQQLDDRRTLVIFTRET